MNRSQRHDLQQKIDLICNQFEDAWLSGSPPSVAEFIAPELDDESRRRVLSALLELDAYFRAKNNFDFDFSELKRSIPWATDIIDCFAANVSPSTLLGAVSTSDTSRSEDPNPPIADSRIEKKRPVRPQTPEQQSTLPRSSTAILSSARAKFLPGELVAQRYRIVSLLGRGGMGEVYRAEDVRLGQTVALKFISEHLTASDQLLGYLYDEVRLSQRLTHPHICRVHDLVESDSWRFISMEYIEGETLENLIRRIGPLPEAKALQIAHQICLGLSAAHQSGILHRDLKPANIMIDDRGWARIADFGLACEGFDRDAEEGLVGTPVYMAPEQFAHNKTSVQSDIYSLGLVLFEMFAGRRVYANATLNSLSQLHETGAAHEAVMSARELTPEVETAIASCLETEPAKRPRSVSAVDALLPGSSALKSVIRSEDTPSPGMVAEVESSPTLTEKAELSLLIAVGLLLALTYVLSGRAFSRFGELRPRDSLNEQAESILTRLGAPNSTHRASAYAPDESMLRRSAKQNLRAGERGYRGYLSPAYFWHRTSPQEMAPRVPDWTGDAFLSVDEQRPPKTVPGSTHLRLGGDGKLRYLSVVIDTSNRRKPSVDSDALFETALGFVVEAEHLQILRPTEPSFVPPHYADELRSWAIDDGSVHAFEIRMARYGSMISYVELKSPAVNDAVQSTNRSGVAGSNRILAILRLIWIPSLAVVAMWLAKRNLFSRRADRQGAFRLCVFCVVAFLCKWLFSGSHVLTALELDLMFSAVAASCLLAATVWCAYVAFEPYVRRHWPRSMVSWSRLLQGRLSDRLVGHDLLIGITAGILATLGKILIVELPVWAGESSYGLSNIYNFAPLGGLRLMAGEILEALNKAVAYSLFFQLLFLMGLRLLVRNTWIASALFVIFLSSLVAVQYEPIWLAFVITAVEMTITAAIYFRVGLLAGVTMHFVRLLLKFPIALEFNAWFADFGHVALLLIMGLAAYAYYCTRKPFGIQAAAAQQPSLAPQSL